MARIFGRKNQPARKQGVMHKAKPKKKPGRWKRRGIRLALAAAIGSTGHFALRHQFGISYPKRIPGIARFYADKRTSFDFYFTTHEVSSDAEGVARAVAKAKSAGKPYNVLVIEAADVTYSERRNAEREYNRWKKDIAVFFDSEKNLMKRMGTLEKRIGFAAESLFKKTKGTPLPTGKGAAAKIDSYFKESLEKKIEEITGKFFYFKLTKENEKDYAALKELVNSYEQLSAEWSEIEQRKHSIKNLKFRMDTDIILGRGKGYGSFVLSLVEIAAKNGMHIKLGEAYSPDELENMRRLRGIWSSPSKDPYNPQQRRLMVKAFAEYLYYRDLRIASALGQIKKELRALPQFQGRSINVMCVFGPSHINAAREFDRATRSIVKRLGEIEANQLHAEAIKLSRKGLDAIRKY